mmetsp:Transcript_52699/g.147891  ORF Transcript_52699/g.147891 Transcript_52699/m.147891 type:complete len:364 (-) Transcript_52699:10-1101(-)
MATSGSRLPRAPEPSGLDSSSGPLSSSSSPSTPFVFPSLSSSSASASLRSSYSASEAASSSSTKRDASKVKRSRPLSPVIFPPAFFWSLTFSSTSARRSFSRFIFQALKVSKVTGVPPGPRAARLSSMMSSMGRSSGAISASTSSWQRIVGLVDSASSTQKTLSLALMKRSIDKFLKVSACLSFSAWIMGWPPSSDMRMPFGLVKRIVFAMPSMISFRNSSFNFFPAATASSSSCLAFFFAAGSKALPFLSVAWLKREFSKAAFATSFCFASFSALCCCSLPPGGAPKTLFVMDLMYFCTTLLLFLFFIPNVLSTAIFSFSFCLALSLPFGGMATNGNASFNHARKVFRNTHAICLGQNGLRA